MTETGDGEVLGFIDARGGEGGCDPLAMLGGVPMVLWGVRALMLAMAGGRVVVAAEGAVGEAVSRVCGAAGVRVLDSAGVEGVFLDRIERGLGGPDLVARVGTPLCGVETARAALGASRRSGGGRALVDFQSSALERLRVTDVGDLELLEAVVGGLGPSHPLVVGFERFRLVLRRVRAVVTDVDGTLTDGRIAFDGRDAGSEGAEPSRAFDTRDGMGMKLLMGSGIGLGVLSSTLRGESSRQRMRMMGVEHVDVAPGAKGERFLRMCGEMGVDAGEVVYFGDDVNDAPAMDLAGLVVCPADAHGDVRARADLVLRSVGGRGAFRELVDVLLGSRALVGWGEGG